MATGTKSSIFSCFSLKTAFKIIVVVAVVIFFLGRRLSSNYSVEEKIQVDEKVNEKVPDIHSNDFAQAQKQFADEEKEFIDPSIQAKHLDKVWNLPEECPKDAVFVLMPFANAKSNPSLQKKFETAVTSMTDLSSVTIVLIVAGDEDSAPIATRIVGSLAKHNIQVNA